MGHYDEFCLEMGMLADVLLTRRLDLVVVNAFWLELKDYEYKLVHRALEQSRRKKWYPFPQIGDLITMIEGLRREQRAKEPQPELPLLPEVSDGRRQANLERLAQIKAALMARMTPGHHP